LIEGRKGQFERASRHLIIAANVGHNQSMEKVKEMYQEGFVSKDDFAAALRAHKAAVDAMKSPQRDAAEAARTMS
jgi:antirestriction protein